MKLTRNDVMWLWAQEHAAKITNAYRRRADGITTHEVAFGCGYTGEILPFAETILAKAHISHEREITAGIMQPKGDSTMVKRKGLITEEIVSPAYTYIVHRLFFRQPHTRDAAAKLLSAHKHNT